MSQKKTKPPAKSEKDDSIRNSPATRALRFLLGKKTEAAAVDPSLPQSDISVVSDAPSDLSSISGKIDSEAFTGSVGAGSPGDGSDSRLQIEEPTETKLPGIQLQESQPQQSWLLESRPSGPSYKKRFDSIPLSINWRSIEHTRIPQVVFDEIIPKLPPMAQVPYLQLLRLTLGFQRENCHISLESWASRCNQSLASIKRQANVLQQRGLLVKENVVYGGSLRGSYYRPVIPGVLNSDSSNEQGSRLNKSRLSESRLNQSRLLREHMKDDHEDLEKKIDHHQNKVMTTYENLTGNRATNSDLTSYRKIAHLDLETIDAQMRQIYERSPEPIGSFAYFAKAIMKAIDEGHLSRAAQKRNLEKIITRIRQNRVGGRSTIADLIDEIKRACARDNVIYNNDLVNEILGL